MNVFGKFPSESVAEGYLNFTHAITKLHWAGVLGARDCNAAKLHFADAETYIVKGQNNPAAIAQRDQLQTYLRVACP